MSSDLSYNLFNRFLGSFKLISFGWFVDFQIAEDQNSSQLFFKDQALNPFQLKDAAVNVKLMRCKSANFYLKVPTSLFSQK